MKGFPEKVCVFRSVWPITENWVSGQMRMQHLGLILIVQGVMEGAQQH